MKIFLQFISLAILAPHFLFAQAPGDEHWDYRFGFPGTSYYQYVIAVDPRNGDVYAAGEQFTMAGTARTTTNIAKWTRSTGYWSALGTGITNSSNGNFADAMAVDPRNGDLYVGGTFTTAGGVSVKNIAKWNGTSWSAVGNSNGIDVKAITINPVNGDVYVGGSFSTVGSVSAANIAKWNGTAWSALGSGINSNVVTLAYDQSTNTLYAGGLFSTAGGKPIQGLAKWNGSDWDSVGFSFYKGSNAGRVYAVCVNGGSVYVTGDFTKIGSSTINYVAAWNSTSWSQIGTIDLSSTGGAKAIASIGSEVFIGGNFNFSGVTPLAFLARWDGAQWLPVGGGITGYASTRVEEMAVYGDELLIAAPQMSATATIAAKNYAIYNTTTQQWSSLGGNGTQGIDNYIREMALGPDGNVYIVGGFKAAGYSASPGIAKWDGTAWSAVARGMVFGSSAPEPRSIAIAPNGDIYVGGKLSQGINNDSSKSALSYYILKYSGGSWQGLGSGLDDDDVNSIVISGSDVYVGGNFRVSGNSKIRYIAKWNGSAWDSVGIGTPVNGAVNSLAVAPNGDLYAGGNFSATGGNTSIQYLARWNGITWDSAGGVPNGTVRKIAFKGSDLYIAGDFSQISGNTIRGMAKWNGTAWDTISSGLSGIDEFAFQGDTLFAAGTITLSDASTTKLAYWDGTTWTALGSGLKNENQTGSQSDGGVNGIVAVGSDIYFCGVFNLAGNKPSYNFARWNSGETISSVRKASNEIPSSFSISQNYPNPFNPVTNFGLRISPQTKGMVSLKVFDVLGREVATLVNENLLPGTYEVSWNAGNHPSGVYFYRLQSGEFVETKRMMLLK
ncbi:MAG: T9SS type A sorting domain-containing protein [Bacteroidetes bacterium]|nr:MAG: T9SS type A sorting domain-containing protein [Bacteroidota bacterium]